MRKSMIATAVVATASLAASANAGYFDITGSSVNTGSGNTNISVADLNAMPQGANPLVADGVNNQKQLTVAQFTAITGALAGSLQTNTLTYFGMDSGGGAPAFFGFAFKATSSYTFGTMQYADDNIYTAPITSGVYAATYDGTNTGGIGTYSTSTKQWSTAGITVAANTTLLVMFAGLPVGGAVAGNTTSATLFGVEYLSWNGTGFSSNYSVGGAGSSGLNVSTYQVPVPAPVLLAGAGLVGAAALRRRMAKKA